MFPEDYLKNETEPNSPRRVVEKLRSGVLVGGFVCPDDAAEDAPTGLGVVRTPGPRVDGFDGDENVCVGVLECRLHQGKPVRPPRHVVGWRSKVKVVVVKM